jgi:hypothetical protein
VGAGPAIRLGDFLRKARRCGCTASQIGGTHWKVTRPLASGLIGVYTVVAESGRHVGAVYVRSMLKRLEIPPGLWERA